MNKMSKQMELFDEGGLMQEGGTVDPVSGNNVPVGSTQEEVRDDIPAQLSEGEFVMPADVVRYHGLDKMMALRDEAKMGLQRMDDMGQMGNSEEAVIPDGVPFDMDDLDMEDDGLEMAQGGVVSMANGGGIIGPLTTGFPASSGALGQQVGQIGTPSLANTAPAGTLGPPIQASPQVVVYGPDGTAYANPAAARAAGVTNYTMTKPISAPVGQASAPMQAASAQFQPLGGTKFTPAPVQTTMPTFQETIGRGVPYVDYDPNAPDGTEQPETPAEVAPPATGQPSNNSGDDGGGDNQTYGGGTSLLTGEKIAGYSPEEIKSGVASAKDRYAITGNRGFDLLNIIPGGAFIKSLMPDSVSAGVFGKDPTIPEDASVPPGIGMPVSAMKARDALQQSLGTKITGYVGFQKGDLDPNSGGFFDKNGIAVDAITGDQTKNESGTFNYSSFDDFKKAFSAGNESGWRGGKVGASTYAGLSPTAKANYDKFANIMGYTDHNKQAKANKAKADKAKAEKAKEEKAAQEQLAASKTAIQQQMQAAFDRNDGQSYNDGDGYDTSGGEESGAEVGGSPGGQTGSQSDVDSFESDLG